MELEKAKEILNKFNDAVSSINSELNTNIYKIKRLDDIELKYKELQKGNNRLKKIENMFNLIKNHTTCDICPQCDGKGGFEIDMGEQGCMGEEWKCVTVMA